MPEGSLEIQILAWWYDGVSIVSSTKIATSHEHVPQWKPSYPCYPRKLREVDFLDKWDYRAEQVCRIASTSRHKQRDVPSNKVLE